MSNSRMDAPDSGAGNRHDVVSDFAGGFVEAMRQPLDGARQLAGAKLEQSPASHESSAAEMVGKFVGGSTLFIGSMVVAKKLPFVGQIADGKLASVTAGSALGFLTPVGENQGITERLMNAGVGAAAMGTMEFAPGALGRIPSLTENSLRNGLIKYGAANGAAGLIQTEGSAFVQTGHGASAEDLALGVGTWALTGAGFHAAGRPFARMAAARAEAKLLDAQRPWQFKNVQSVNASELNSPLQPGHYNVQFESQGYGRSFDLYISEKAGQSTNGSAPMVTFLHGLSPKGTSHHIIRELSFNKFADEDGAVVAYLHARDGRHGPLTGDSHNWNDTNFGFTKHDPTYSDSVAFGDMVNVIKQHVPTARTDDFAVTGFSLGGKMAHRIAATRTDVSSIGTIHGTIDAMDQALMRNGINQRNVDAIIIHGDKDRVLPLNGGRGLFTFLLENAGLQRPREQAPFWSSRLGSTEPFITQAPEYTRRDWFAADNSARVTEYVVRDGGHAIHGAHAKKNLIQWAMGEPKPDNYFDARRRTWNFVMRSLSKPNEQGDAANKAVGF